MLFQVQLCSEGNEWKEWVWHISKSILNITLRTARNTKGHEQTTTSCTNVLCMDEGVLFSLSSPCFFNIHSIVLNACSASANVYVRCKRVPQEKDSMLFMQGTELILSANKLHILVLLVSRQQSERNAHFRASSRKWRLYISK